MERAQPAEFEMGRKRINHAIRQRLIDFGMTAVGYREQVMGPDDAPIWLVVEVTADNGGKADVTFNREQVDDCVNGLGGHGVFLVIENLARRLKALDRHRELIAS